MAQHKRGCHLILLSAVRPRIQDQLFPMAVPVLHKRTMVGASTTELCTRVETRTEQQSHFDLGSALARMQAISQPNTLKLSLNATQLELGSTFLTTMVTAPSPSAPSFVDEICSRPFDGGDELWSLAGALAVEAASAIASGLPFLGRGAGVGSTLAVTTLCAPILRKAKHTFI